MKSRNALASRHALGVQKQDFVIHAGKATWLLFDQMRFERTLAIPGYVDLKGAVFANQGFAGIAVAAVAAIGQLMLVVALSACPLQAGSGRPDAHPAQHPTRLLR